MSRSRAASALRSIEAAIFVALALLAARAGAKEVALVPVPKLECGTYQGRGRLRTNARGDYLLSLNEKTDSPSELILLGGDIDTLVARTGGRVTVEFYVPQPIDGSDRSFVFLQAFVKPGKDSRTPSSENDYIDLSKREPCGDRSRLKQ